jgi:hypothetical protein
MGHLIGLSSEPAKLSVSDYVVKDHQALNGSTERHSFAKANIALLYGFVQRRVVDVKDAGLVVPAPIGRCELAARQFVQEVDQLLTAGDARKRAVLATQEEAGVQHYLDQECSLALREAECGDPRDPLLVRHRNSSKMPGL